MRQRGAAHGSALPRPTKNLEEDPWDGRRSRTYKELLETGREGTDFETRLKAIPGIHLGPR